MIDYNKILKLIQRGAKATWSFSVALLYSYIPHQILSHLSVVVLEYIYIFF